MGNLRSSYSVAVIVTGLAAEFVSGEELHASVLRYVLLRVRMGAEPSMSDFLLAFSAREESGGPVVHILSDCLDEYRRSRLDVLVRDGLQYYLE